ncbi:glycosyltransferase family 2 protein [Desulfosarcina sp. OttesenSCG-928-G10]|nr:glycosyltransferase family 2 protein [Desulfosarcina sp. OttesenSCG-928-G10]MDL2321189.1 glycosyltransferase family 2 protein [Desulfosarcina sp. OttesenSCG-928-B08]
MRHLQISIIMPAYNVATYIGPSIESVRQQSGVSWELLIVDDGSTDETLEIMCRYASVDPRIKILKNKGLKGPGGSRNTGLHAAQGKAILFLDSDDFLYPDALRALWECHEKTAAPVVKGLGKIFCHQRWLLALTKNIHNHQDYISIEEIGYPRHSFCYYLYDLRFLIRHGITFPEDLIVGEDTTFLCHVHSHLTTLPVINQIVHFYRINHKPATPSAAKAMAAAERAIRSRTLFEQQGKNAFVIPYLERIFFSEWHGHLYSAQAEGKAHAEALMQRWSQLLSGQGDVLMPVLQEQLGSLAIPFIVACGKQDTAEMLAILNKSGIVHHPSYYMGIDRPAHGPAWHTYRFLRRLRSLVLSRETRCALRYLFSMHWRSRSTLSFLQTKV